MYVYIHSLSPDKPAQTGTIVFEHTNTIYLVIFRHFLCGYRSSKSACTLALYEHGRLSPLRNQCVLYFIMYQLEQEVRMQGRTGRLMPACYARIGIRANFLRCAWSGNLIDSENRIIFYIFYFSLEMETYLFDIITKTCLFKYTENFTTKKWKISDKNSDIFNYFCSKHRLWVLVRTASTRRF